MYFICVHLRGKTCDGWSEIRLSRCAINTATIHNIKFTLCSMVKLDQTERYMD